MEFSAELRLHQSGWHVALTNLCDECLEERTLGRALASHPGRQSHKCRCRAGSRDPHPLGYATTQTIPSVYPLEPAFGDRSQSCPLKQGDRAGFVMAGFIDDSSAEDCSPDVMQVAPLTAYGGLRLSDGNACSASQALRYDMAPGAPRVRSLHGRRGVGWPRRAVVSVTALLVFGTAACGPGGHSKSAAGGAGPAAPVVPTNPVVAQLHWSAPEQIDTNQDGLFNVSCPSASFCVAVGSTGPGVVGSARMWNGTSWSASTTQAFARDTFVHVSCSSATFCMAGAPSGDALTWNGSAWSGGSQIRWPDPKDGITNLSCGSPNLCLAGDEDGDIRVWNGAAWSIDHQLVAGSTSGGAHSISCASASFCVAVNYLGNAIVWNGTSLSAPAHIDEDPNLVTVSCPSAGFCMVINASSYDWLAWNGTSWSAPKPIQRGGAAGSGPPGPGGPGQSHLSWVSCPSPAFCVAVSSNGTAIEWNGTAWSPPLSIDPNLANNASSNSGLRSVSCPSLSFCVAVGSDGRAVIGRRAS